MRGRDPKASSGDLICRYFPSILSGTRQKPPSSRFLSKVAFSTCQTENHQLPYRREGQRGTREGWSEEAKILRQASSPRTSHSQYSPLGPPPRCVQAEKELREDILTRPHTPPPSLTVEPRSLSIPSPSLSQPRLLFLLCRAIPTRATADHTQGPCHSPHMVRRREQAGAVL